MACVRDGEKQAVEERFQQLLSQYARIAIVGGPDTGKSTLAAVATDREVISSDDWLPGQRRHNPALDWSAQSLDMVRVCSRLSRFVFEGVRAAHALRKGLQVDAVVCRWRPWLPLTTEQAAMAKGISEKVFPGWLALNAGRVPVIEL